VAIVLEYPNHVSIPLGVNTPNVRTAPSTSSQGVLIGTFTAFMVLLRSINIGNNNCNAGLNLKVTLEACCDINCDVNLAPYINVQTYLLTYLPRPDPHPELDIPAIKS